MKLYIAYGSNMNKKVIKSVSSFSIKLFSGNLIGYNLVFRGLPNTSYLSIEENNNSSIPVVVYLINNYTESQLDNYESYPELYKKIEKKFKLSINNKVFKINAMLYQMVNSFKDNLPNIDYYNTCLDAYNNLGFDKNILVNTFNSTKEIVESRTDLGFPEFSINPSTYYDETNFFKNKLQKKK